MLTMRDREQPTTTTTTSKEEHMSKKVLTTTLAAFACAAVVGAQAPPPQQVPAPNAPPAAAPTQRPPDQKSTSADNVIVTGCLERRAASIATPGAAGAPAGNEAPAFVLTKVMRPVGTAGSSSATPAAASYRLDADASKLSAHVGEKVEITGMIANRSDSSSASRAAGGDAPQAKGADTPQLKAGADGPQLKVDSVKMIAKTCTE
jgi:hypothetical protein